MRRSTIIAGAVALAVAVPLAALAGPGGDADEGPIVGRQLEQRADSDHDELMDELMGADHDQTMNELMGADHDELMDEHMGTDGLGGGRRGTGRGMMGAGAPIQGSSDPMT